MTSDGDVLQRHDVQTHKTRAWAFWALSGAMTSALVIAYPPVRALGAGAGWVIAGALTALNLAYVIRLYCAHGAQGDREDACAAICAVVALAIVQWLCGGYGAPLAIVLTAHIFGGAAVLTGRMRAVHLSLVLTAVLTPAVYGAASGAQLVAAVVWVLLLLMQAGFLYEYGARLRAQRQALLEAQRLAAAQALTDPLTGLHNRRALEADLDTATQSIAGGEALTVIYLDLDGFKAHNDDFGHGAGDELLARLGRSLGAAAAGHGRAYRVGGDEFCVLLDGVHRIGDRIPQAIAAALTERGRGFAICPSWGAAVAPDDTGDVRAAVRLADQRMYEAKRGAAVRAA